MALSNPTTNDRLPEQNRDGGIEQDWAGDDQDWWDWYVTLAANDATPTELVDGPGLPDVAPAGDEQVERELAEPYDLEEGDSIHFRTAYPHSWANPSDRPARAIWLAIRSS